MASLKEIKRRITSVKSTQKITSAMKMVASSKLRKAQSRIDSFLPYQYKLNEILYSFLTSITDFESNLSEKREVKSVAIVVLSSNSSLCGAFNSNIVKLLEDTINRYREAGCEHIGIYPIGKKVEEQACKSAIPVQIMGSYIKLMDNPNFEGAKQIAYELMNNFLQRKIDKVELIYNHFKTMAIQIPTIEEYLPFQLDEKQRTITAIQTDYIVEPDKKTVLQLLLPKSLHNKIYAVLLDSAVAEQGARVVAMQIATDNASEILDELTVQYNKQRQQTITSELLDIIGGSESLK